MSKPIGSICCDYTVTVLTVLKTDHKTGSVVPDHEFNLFQCDECGSVSKECVA